MKEASDLKNLHILVTISTSIQRNLTWKIFTFLDISTWNQQFMTWKFFNYLETHEALEQTIHNLKTFTLLASIAQESIFFLINFYWWGNYLISPQRETPSFDITLYILDEQYVRQWKVVDPSLIGAWACFNFKVQTKYAPWQSSSKFNTLWNGNKIHPEK